MFLSQGAFIFSRNINDLPRIVYLLLCCVCVLLFFLSLSLFIFIRKLQNDLKKKFSLSTAEPSFRRQSWNYFDRNKFESNPLLMGNFSCDSQRHTMWCVICDLSNNSNNWLILPLYRNEHLAIFGTDDEFPKVQQQIKIKELTGK